MLEEGRNLKNDFAFQRNGDLRIIAWKGIDWHEILT
jgi:hypothetical protein